VTITAYRPPAPTPSILTEVVCRDHRQRFQACASVSASIWAAGLNSCGTPAERAAWQREYAEHLHTLTRIWAPPVDDG
jgi:hypothetical protein